MSFKIGSKYKFKDTEAKEVFLNLWVSNKEVCAELEDNGGEFVVTKINSDGDVLEADFINGEIASNEFMLFAEEFEFFKAI